MTNKIEVVPPASSAEVRGRLVDALRLDLVGPWATHPFAEERLPGWVYPSNWYLTGFLIPVATPPEKAADDDEDDELGTVEPGGLAEETHEEKKAAKKAFFPSSMGVSFLVAATAKGIEVEVRWGDYEKTEIAGEEEGKPVPVWQRRPREAAVAVQFSGRAKPQVLNVPESGGLQLHVVERVMGLLLAAVAIEFVVGGLRELWPALR